ncbi:MAG TPA: membrane protein insertion efficiency factor YidD [Armatimonadota bacterium]
MYAGIVRVISQALVGCIRIYQKLSRGRPRVCRYEPTCSEYTAQAITKYGPIKGIAMGAWRICRCNPWSPGGYDPVK